MEPGAEGPSVARLAETPAHLCPCCPIGNVNLAVGRLAR